MPLRNGRICNIEYINGLFDHGLLLGLGDDNHPQYGEIAQTENISGAWSFEGLTLNLSQDYLFTDITTSLVLQ
ncbi:hypothetical protein LCGC14_1614750, partial [marine sediment metagenome]